MSTQKSYPHYTANIKDRSIAEVRFNEILPIHRPCYMMRAERGEFNRPIWCANYNEAIKHFGKETFTETSEYFSLQALYLKHTLLHNGAFIVRVADEATAKKAFVILEAHVATNVDVPQYEVDEDGNRIRIRNTDVNSPNYGMLEYVVRTTDEVNMEEGDHTDPYDNPLGDPYGNPIGGEIPVTTSNPYTEPGIKIQWRTRLALLDGESGLDDLQIEPGGNNEYIYPIMAFEALSLGKYGNNLGFSLFYDKAQNSESVINKFKSVFYSIEIGEKEANKSSITPIAGNFGSMHTFAANADAVNPDTNYAYNMEGIITRAFASSNNKLPCDIYTYEENLRIIGNKVVEAELNSSSLTNGGLYFIDADNYDEFEGITSTINGFVVSETSPAGYYVNVLSGINIHGVTYDHLIVDKEDINVNAVVPQSKSYIYLKNGADGDISDSRINESLIKFFRGQLPADGSIVDNARYPITHIYDTGFPMEVKLEMIEFLGLRDDIMIELSTQVVETGQVEFNKQSEDEENGQFLRARALLQMESLEKGTDCCRCAIYPQAGTLVDSSYNGIVPFTIWSAIKHAQYGNGTSLSTVEPRGLPNALNEYFKSYNWLNFTAAGQNRVWDAGLNYCQSADMTRIFYPALRTVYRADSSVLTDQWFVDALVYTKHIIRMAWTTYVGRNDPSDVLNTALTTYLTNALTTLFNGKYTFEVAVTQNEEERRLGYIRHAYIRIVSPATMRVLEVDIEVSRENYNQEDEEQ